MNNAWALAGEELCDDVVSNTGTGCAIVFPPVGRIGTTQHVNMCHPTYRIAGTTRIRCFLWVSRSRHAPKR